MDGFIFVFGSNTSGHHGKGAAKYAYQVHGAQYGLGVGPMGNSYAIPTKQAVVRPRKAGEHYLETLPLADVQKYVDQFIAYAQDHPELRFQVTRIGCGLAGLKDSDIAPMFHNAPSNCWFDNEWMNYPPPRGRVWKYWGSFGQ